MATADLSVICKPDRKVRETWYSETFRANITIDGEKRVCDITHISIPFEEKKEEALKAQFGFRDDELEAFYTRFAECVSHSLKKLDELNKSENEKVVDNTAKLVVKQRKKKEGIRGSDIYIATEALAPFVGSQFLGKDSCSLSDVTNLGLRLVQTIRVFSSEHNSHIGAFDLDSLLVRIGDKPFMVLSSFMYSIGDGKPLPKTAPLCADKGLVNGNSPTSLTEFRSVCAIVWNILSGKNYNDEPDMELELGKDYPQEFVSAIKDAYYEDDFDKAIKTFRDACNALRKKLQNGSAQDKTIWYAQRTPIPPDGEGETTEDVSFSSKDMNALGDQPVAEVDTKDDHLKSVKSAEATKAEPLQDEPKEELQQQKALEETAEEENVHQVESESPALPGAESETRNEPNLESDTNKNPDPQAEKPMDVAEEEVFFIEEDAATGEVILLPENSEKLKRKNEKKQKRQEQRKKKKREKQAKKMPEKDSKQDEQIDKEPSESTDESEEPEKMQDERPAQGVVEPKVVVDISTKKLVFIALMIAFATAIIVATIIFAPIIREAVAEKILASSVLETVVSLKEQAGILGGDLFTNGI